MRLDSRAPEKLAGVLYDHGAARAVRFAVWFDAATGEYEAIRVASNGVDMAVDDCYKPIRYRGSAVGRLELVPIDRAEQLGVEPKKVQERVATALPPGAVEQGLEDYKKLYHRVWRLRGEARRCVDGRWGEFLAKNDFLDHLVIKRRLK